MRKLAVAIFDYFAHGGLQKDCLALLQNSIDHGDQITLLTHSCEGELPKGVSLQLIESRGYSNHQRAWHFSETIRQLKQTDYALIVGFNKMAGLDYYFAGDSCLAGTIPWYQNMLPRYQRYLALEQQVFMPQATTKIWTLTAQQQQAFRHHYQTPIERFTVLPPSVAAIYQDTDAAFNQRQAWRTELGLTDQDVVLLMVASYFRTKGLDRTLQTLAMLPQKNCHLLVIGDDNPQPFLAQLPDSVSVHFMGAQSNLLPFYMSADVLIHPAYQEAAGQVLLEALCCGLPIVTTANCGYHYHVNRAQGGAVLPDTWPLIDSVNALQTILTIARAQWYQRLQFYKIHFNFNRGQQLRQLLS